MLNELKHSHFLLIFLSGSLGAMSLIPLIVYLVNPLPITNIGDIYATAIKFASEAGFLGSMAGIAMVYFVGIAIDGLSIISRRRRPISRMKKLIGRLWGYGRMLNYLETHRGLRSQFEPGIPSEVDAAYARQIMWFAEYPAFGAARGWEFFMSFSFSLFTLTLGWLFALLVAVTVVLWAKYGFSPVTSIPWILTTSLVYALLVLGEISHAYAKVTMEEVLKKEFERSQTRG